MKPPLTLIEACDEYDWGVVSTHEDEQGNEIEVKLPPAEYALYTIGDKSVGKFSHQISPWFSSIKQIECWWELMQDIIRDRAL